MDIVKAAYNPWNAVYETCAFSSGLETGSQIEIAECSISARAKKRSAPDNCCIAAIAQRLAIAKAFALESDNFGCSGLRNAGGCRHKGHRYHG